MRPGESARQAREERYRAEERESLEKKGDWGQMRRLLQYLRPRRRTVALAVGISIGMAFLIPVPMILVKYTIDEHITAASIQGILFMAALLALSQVVLFAMDAWTTMLIARIGQDSMRDLRLQIFRHIQQQPLRFFDKNPVGRLITRLTSDVNVLNELFAQGVVGLFQQVFSLIVIAGVLLYYNWQLTLWLVPVLPLVAWASWNFRNNVYFAYRLSRVRLSRLNSFMQENITGMKTVQANTREGEQYETFDRLNDLNRQSLLQIVFQYALFFPLVEIISTLALALVLWRGGVQYLNPAEAAAGTTISVGALALFIQALDRFFQPIKDLSEKYNILQSAIAASERLFVLLDTKPGIVDPPHAVTPGPLAHEIEFRDVWFAYNGEDWVLKGVSFKLGKGHTAAIVGPTGSGKTTLMSLLCRFYDIQKGAILIDGVDIREMRQADLRQKIAIVLQEVFLFYGTVTDNVRLGDRTIPEDRVRRVCEETGFDEYVAQMPKGYDSGIKERGATLSTGQKQLLSFARALAFDPEILILDEATANVDTATEEKLQQAVALLCAGRTSIVIAHRLSTIQRADLILVMHHGHLVEQGRHEELLARDGLYRRLYNLQYKERAAAG